MKDIPTRLLLAVEEGELSFFSLQVAQSFDPTSFEEALFLAALWDHSARGHLCLHNESNLRDFGSLAKEISLVLQEPAFLQEKPYICFPEENVSYLCRPVAIWNDRIYWQKNWLYESYILQEIQRLFSDASFSLEKKDTFFARVDSDPHLRLDQKNAIKNVCTRPFSLILGGPGTGKTFTITKLVRYFADWTGAKAKILLTAPTGKADYNLEQKIGEKNKEISFSLEVKTLHAVLGRTKNRSFSFASSPLPYDLIIVDEAAMIDAGLMAELLLKVSSSTRLVFVGDPDQLPAIESGSILYDLSQDASCVFSLAKATRFSNQALIDFSYAIKVCDLQFMEQCLKEENSIAWKCAETNEDLEKQVLFSLEEYIQKWSEKKSIGDALDYMQKVQYICPWKEGKIGVHSINTWCHTSLVAKERSSYFFPVIITENQKEYQVYNGMQGVLMRAEHSTEEAIYFPGKDPIVFSAVQPEKKPSFAFAFCLSVHKSQGSEFDEVRMILPERSDCFGRKMLYSGVTRAKKDLAIFSSKDTLFEAAKKDSWKDSSIALRQKINQSSMCT